MIVDCEYKLKLHTLQSRYIDGAFFTRQVSGGSIELPRDRRRVLTIRIPVIDYRNQGYLLNRSPHQRDDRVDYNRSSVMSLCPSSSHQLVAAAIAFRRARRKFPKDFGLESRAECVSGSAKVTCLYFFPFFFFKVRTRSRDKG